MVVYGNFIVSVMDQYFYLLLQYKEQKTYWTSAVPDLQILFVQLPLCAKTYLFWNLVKLASQV